MRVDKARTHVGDPTTEPALIETMQSAGLAVGKIEVGPRQRAPFSAAEVEKLRNHSRVIAHVLKAAEQQQQAKGMYTINANAQLTWEARPSVVLLTLSWFAVGLPLLWGIGTTMQQAIKFFI